MANTTTDQLSIAKDVIEGAIRHGDGPPLLLLHGLEPFDSCTPFIRSLGTHHEVISPTHPGFAQSSRPDSFDSIYDLVHLYLEVIESLPYDNIGVAGFSFGGWIAAELAVKCPQRLPYLILVDSLGFKLGGPESAEIFDIFNARPDEVSRRRWHDPDDFEQTFDDMTDEALIGYAKTANRYACMAGSPTCTPRPSHGGYIESPALLWCCGARTTESSHPPTGGRSRGVSPPPSSRSSKMLAIIPNSNVRVRSLSG